MLQCIGCNPFYISIICLIQSVFKFIPSGFLYEEESQKSWQLQVYNELEKSD